MVGVWVRPDTFYYFYIFFFITSKAVSVSGPIQNAKEINCDGNDLNPAVVDYDTILVSGNRSLSSAWFSNVQHEQTVTTLIIKGCLVAQLDDVKLFPNLQKLHLLNADLTQFNFATLVQNKNLRLLSLNDNPRLGKLTGSCDVPLTKISLSNTSFIRFPDSLNEFRPSLRDLVMSNEHTYLHLKERTICSEFHQLNFLNSNKCRDILSNDTLELGCDGILPNSDFRSIDKLRFSGPNDNSQKLSINWTGDIGNEQARNISALIIEGCMIDEPDESEIDKFVNKFGNLRKLNLTNVGMLEFNLTKLQNMHDLRVLILNNNARLADIYGECNLPLHKISLTNSGFRYFPEALYQFQPTLRTLDISTVANWLHSDSYQICERFERLIQFNNDECVSILPTEYRDDILKYDCDGTLTKPHRKQSLDGKDIVHTLEFVGHNKNLSSDWSDVFAGKDNIATITIHGCRMVEKQIAEIAEYPNLHKLVLNNVGLESFNLNLLENNAKLTALSLDHNENLHELHGESKLPLDKISLKNSNFSEFPDELTQFRQSLRYLVFNGYKNRPKMNIRRTCLTFHELVLLNNEECKKILDAKIPFIQHIRLIINDYNLEVVDEDIFLHFSRSGPNTTFAQIHMQRNNINHIDRDAFAAFSNLTHLLLAENNLTELSINVPNLRVLDLSFNRFESINNNFFERLPLLTNLNITGNAFKSIAWHIDFHLHLNEVDASSNYLLSYVLIESKTLKVLVLHNEGNVKLNLVTPAMIDLDLRKMQIKTVNSTKNYEHFNLLEANDISFNRLVIYIVIVHVVLIIDILLMYCFWSQCLHKTHKYTQVNSDSGK